MRRTVLLAGVLLSVVALGSDSPKEYEDKTEYAPIEGTWEYVNATQNGNVFTATRHRITYRGGIYIQQFVDGTTWKGRYRLDMTHKPWHFDKMPFPGEVYPGIVKIEGDTLTLGTQVDKGRPKDFNEQWVPIWTYKRVK